MNTDVQIVGAVGLGEKLVEILHLLEEERLLANEVLLHFSVLVSYVYEDVFVLRNRFYKVGTIILIRA